MTFISKYGSNAKLHPPSRGVKILFTKKFLVGATYMLDIGDQYWEQCSKLE